jgi:hypothetical protein
MQPRSPDRGFFVISLFDASKITFNAKIEQVGQKSLDGWKGNVFLTFRKTSPLNFIPELKL